MKTHTHTHKGNSCRRFFFKAFRSIFALSLIVLMLKFFQDKDHEENFLKNNLKQFSTTLPFLKMFSNYAQIIIALKNFLLFLGAFLLLIGKRIGSYAVLFWCLIQLGLIYNPIIYKEEKYKQFAFVYVGITFICLSI